MRKLILLLSCSDHTPLHYSARFGHIEGCRLLLQCNADVEAKDCAYLPNPFYSYCSYEAKLVLRKIIRFLLFSQNTPLHRSVQTGHVEVCRLLVESKADIVAKTRCFSLPPSHHFSLAYALQIWPHCTRIGHKKQPKTPCCIPDKHWRPRIGV